MHAYRVQTSAILYFFEYKNIANNCCCCAAGWYAAIIDHQSSVSLSSLCVYEHFPSAKSVTVCPSASWLVSVHWVVVSPFTPTGPRA